MKDVATPATQSEVRGTIKEALTKAALVNYERLSEEARIEGKFQVLWISSPKVSFIYVSTSSAEREYH